MAGLHPNQPFRHVPQFYILSTHGLINVNLPQISVHSNHILAIGGISLSMFDCIEAWRRRNERRAIIVGKSVMAAAMIAGCSWVPDAMNPVEWYKGIANTISSDDTPEIASPRRPDGSYPDVNGKPAQTASQQGKGLVADKQNSQYAPAVKREPTPTTQLARRTPAPATQVAQVPAADGKALPNADQRMQTARDEGPAAPPRVAAGGPPAPAGLPDTIPTRRSLLTDHYQMRLAQSASATNKEGPFAKVPPARPESSYNQPVHTYAVPANAPIRAAYADADGAAPVLTPPGQARARGAKGAVIPAQPAAMFQVGSVRFAQDANLSASDRAALKDVVELQKRTKGTVRVVGMAAQGPISFVGDAEDLAQRRANAVAAALTGMGVPKSKVLVAAESGAGIFDDSGARISIEY
jgi:outer membrane protein OmpA-like peptidoglycan-associated protein